MRFIPMTNKVTVKPRRMEEGIREGFVIPTSVSELESPSEGVVLELGGGEEIRESKIEKGDVVIFSKFSGAKYKWQEEDILILDIADITGIIKKD